MAAPPNFGPARIRFPVRAFSATATLAILAGCGGDAAGIVVRGDFAPGGRVPTSVVALEAGRGADVGGEGFALDDLSTSPISLRLLADGDTVGRIDLPDLPDGAELTLHGVRLDAASGRAFPATIEIRGASRVIVNGIRMMNADALPGTVDATGVVLAAASDHSALLVRPGDDALPDLRVVVSPTTATVAPDSSAAVLNALEVGDSVRVQGPSSRGFVLADRLTVLGISPTAATEPRQPQRVAADGSSNDASANDAPRNDPPQRTVAAPVVVPVVRRSPPALTRREHGPGRARGRGNGKAKGKGRG